ncbi:MAG: hypothetical protein ACOCTG_05380 [Bacteroidota bacterium]
MSEQIDTTIRAARIKALAAELQLIASMAQDHVQKYGGWQCDFEHEFQKVRGQLDEAIQRAEQDNAEAAAPELYEELKMIADSIEGGGRVVTFQDHDIQNINEALAKARGEDGGNEEAEA